MRAANPPVALTRRVKDEVYALSRSNLPEKKDLWDITGMEAFRKPLSADP